MCMSQWLDDSGCCRGACGGGGAGGHLSVCAVWSAGPRTITLLPYFGIAVPLNFFYALLAPVPPPSPPPPPAPTTCRGPCRHLLLMSRLVGMERGRDACFEPVVFSCQSFRGSGEEGSVGGAHPRLPTCSCNLIDGILALGQRV